MLESQPARSCASFLENTLNGYSADLDAIALHLPRAGILAFGGLQSSKTRWHSMKVSIDDLDVEMTLGNNGVRFAVYSNEGEYLGKLRVGKATVEWCKGKVQVGNGIKMNWNDLISLFEQQK